MSSAKEGRGGFARAIGFGRGSSESGQKDGSGAARTAAATAVPGQESGPTKPPRPASARPESPIGAAEPAPAAKANGSAKSVENGSGNGAGPATPPANVVAAPAVSDTSPAAAPSAPSAPAARTSPVEQAKASPVEQAKASPVEQAKASPVEQAKASPAQQAKPSPAQQAKATAAQQAPEQAPKARQFPGRGLLNKQGAAKPGTRDGDSPRPPAGGAPAGVPAQAPSQPAFRSAPIAVKELSDAPVPKSKLGRTKGGDALRAPRVRRARLKIANIDPWSVMKVSFLFSVALGVILLVAVALLWALLDFMGFFSTVATTIDDISGEEGSTGFDVVGFFSLPRVLGMATIVALIDIVLITALTTLGAYLYNLSTDLVGGVEVTLAEEE